jgi:acetolactate synthase I/II/III large subunit
MMNGADILANIFKEHGLKRVFTFPGGTIAPIFDALVRRHFEIVCARHEQGAGYIALAIARLTRKPQVVLVTSGPGVTNLATVIADAYFDSTPLIAITGQVGTGDLCSGRKVRQCGFQQIDTVSLMQSITKATFQPKSIEELAVKIEEAFIIATEGRPGPVVLDVPMNIQMGICEDSKERFIREPKNVPDPDLNLVKRVAELLATAERPVIFAGQGVLLSDAVCELRELAVSRDIPVVTSLLGLGAFPTNAPLSLGFAGHTGNQYAGLALYDADVVLVVGARLDVRQTGSLPDKFVPNGKIIRIDLDKAELEYPRVKSHVDIHSDAKRTLSDLISILRSKAPKDTRQWHEKIAGWKKLFPLDFDKKSTFIKPQHIIKAVNMLTLGEKVIVTSGVGSHQQWSARHFDYDLPNRVWLTSGGHGAMGYDLPSAIGAQIAFPDYTVVCFVGDGSFQMNIQELQSVIEFGTPIKIFILDNKRLAMVSQFQLLNWPSDPTTGNKNNPNFAAIAKAYGIKAFTLDDPHKVETVIQEALEYEGPTLVHCHVDPHEDVVPMLLAGQTMDKMWPYTDAKNN